MSITHTAYDILTRILLTFNVRTYRNTACEAFPIRVQGISCAGVVQRQTRQSHDLLSDNSRVGSNPTSGTSPPATHSSSHLLRYNISQPMEILGIVFQSVQV